MSCGDVGFVMGQYYSVAGCCVRIAGMTNCAASTNHHHRHAQSCVPSSITSHRNFTTVRSSVIGKRALVRRSTT